MSKTTWTPERLREMHRAAAGKYTMRVGADPCRAELANGPSDDRRGLVAQFRYASGAAAYVAMHNSLSDLLAEIERLRAELAATIRMTDESVRLAVRDERKAIEAEQAEAAQQGPSDEEIDSAIDSVRRHRLNSEDAFIETYHALRKIARRAGVKL